MTDNDDFMRANQSTEASQSVMRKATQSTTGRSTMMKKKVDPYALDFTELRKEYVDSSSVKIPFVKSSFVHYSKCPRNMTINGKEYKDLVVTMEVIQAPETLKYSQLEDPVEARKKAKLAAKKAELEKKKAEAKAAKQAAKDEKIAARAAVKAAKAAAKAERQERRMNNIQSGEGDSYGEEEEEEDDDDDDYDEEEDEDDEEDDNELELDDDEDDDESGYGEEEDSGYGSEYGSEGDSLGDEEDREYTGDMFKKGKRIKFAAAPFDKLGVHNPRLSTNDYCCVAIWSAGGQLQRYTRLKDTTLRVPPLETDQVFRVGHDAKRLYYIGKLDGRAKLVIIYLKDLSHEFLDLGPDSEKIETFEGSSLFKNYICYAMKRKIEIKSQGKTHWRWTQDFHVVDFRKIEKVWSLEDCESVLFVGKEAAKQKEVEYEENNKKLRSEAPGESSDEEGGDDEDDGPKLSCEVEEVEDIDSDADEAEHEAEAEAGKGEGDWESRVQRLHKGVLVLKTRFDDKKIEAEKKPEAEGEEGKKDAADAAQEEEQKKDKVVTVRRIQAFYPQWCKPINKKRLAFEVEFETKMNAVTQGVVGAIDEADTQIGKKEARQLEENPLLIVSDNLCMVMSLIIKGVKGEQHRVNTFNLSKRGPIFSTNRAGNTDLEYNMNSHVRNFKQIFICETAPNGDVTAKQVQIAVEEKTELPPLVFTKPLQGYAKDCWTLPADENGDEDGPTVVMTICKSSTDEYLNADCTLVNKIEGDDEGITFKTESCSSKIKAQEIDLNYPCLVSNVGLSRLMIQSLTCPDQVSTFNLDGEHMEFICFADYRQLEDVGFKDMRDAVQAEIVPFSETGDKIAFVTRFFNPEGEEDKQGEMLLNVLSIDSYTSPMRFELFVTSYEACMDEGMSDDSIQKCVAMQMTSQRGLDVTFVAQYNDRIIFDCVTSTKQMPLRCPLPLNAKVEEKWRETDPDFKKEDGEIQFEQIDIFKGVDMVRQPMVMDDHGALYFMIKTGETIKVLRVDPVIEMGGAGFIKSVFSLRSSCIYFLLNRGNTFYIMDDQKKIRVLKPNDETYVWRQDTTFELCQSDAKQIVYSDFDEYCISDGVLQANDRMYFLLDSRAKDNATWDSANVMLENHLHVSGPRYAKESGMIWYIQQYAANIQDDTEGDELNMLSNQQAFKGFSVVMQPLGDLSYLDLLPQRGENNNNFVSFVTDTHVLINYGGRYLVFNLKGAFQGAVKFTGASEGFRSDQIKLVNVSDSGKFFVFQGPHFLSKAERDEKKRLKKEKKAKKKQQKQDQDALAGGMDGAGNAISKALDKAADKLEKKDNDKFASGGKKADIFYVFNLRMDTKLSGATDWSFVPYETTLFPWIEPNIKSTMTQRIDFSGVLSQCLIKSTESAGEEREMTIVVKNYKSQNPKQDAVEQDLGMFGFRNILPENPESEERYRISFNAHSHLDKKVVLERKILNEQKAMSLGAGSESNLIRLKKREQQIERAWVFDNFIIAKSGCEIKYMPREKSVLGMSATNSIPFGIEPGAEVWIENIYATGIEDLVQLFIIDDAQKRLFIITWNLQLNREHSIFQTTYGPDVFPENLIMRGKHYYKQQDFNYFMDNFSIINLETNLPIQFFDTENETDVLPTGVLNMVDGMKRISSDWSRYLDMTKPGRVHHFISYADLLYWERFQVLKERHEVSKGIMSTFSPIARFPKGISVFHYYATNVRVLNTVQDAMQIAKNNRQDDSRVNMLPLVFLHSNPALNAPGKKTTAIHIALDKQSPIAFELMFELLVNQQKVCVTSQLLDVLDPIINSSSQAVLDFFNSSFLITDQFAGLRALEWEIEGEDLICATGSAYITDEYLQSLVKPSITDIEDEDAEVEELDSQVRASEKAQDEDAPFKYSSATVEPRTRVPDDSCIKQIEAKILDFNWLFTGENTKTMMSTLAETENDEIFAQDQIRVFVDFMWQGYYDAIFSQLFLPFLIYFASFLAYTGYFAKNESSELSIPFILEIICIVLFGKTFFTFLILEIIQIKSNGFSYFFDMWNIIDISSLGINAFYVYAEITNFFPGPELQVIASVACLLMWVKMFYWMRLFQPFSAFIRMITEIIKDVKVFLVMLLISLFAFANIIFVLNKNRIVDDQAPIFEPLIGIAPIDAIIHAYLTGLGDFGKDNYSEDNSMVVWIMFILATLIVQLIFMNLLIAIMGESFARINGIMQQSTMKELCSIMTDMIWLQKIEEIFENKRYILWLTTDTSTGGGTVVERQIAQLKEMVKTGMDAQESRIIRAIGAVQEDVATLGISVAELNKRAGDAEDSDDY